jgi:hypothetical protein
MLELYFLFIGFYAIPVCVMFVSFSPPAVVKRVTFALLLECMYCIGVVLTAILAFASMGKFDDSVLVFNENFDDSE